MNGRTPATPQIEPAFIEQNFGDWQGLAYEDIGAYGRVRPGTKGSASRATSSGSRRPSRSRPAVKASSK